MLEKVINCEPVQDVALRVYTMKRVMYWTIGLAIIGGVLASKSATIEPDRVLVGMLGGAFLGFCIGYLIHKAHTRSPR